MLLRAHSRLLGNRDPVVCVGGESSEVPDHHVYDAVYVIDDIDVHSKGRSAPAQMGSTSGQSFLRIANAPRCWYGREMSMTERGSLPAAVSSSRVRNRLVRCPRPRNGCAAGRGGKPPAGNPHLKGVLGTAA